MNIYIKIIELYRVFKWKKWFHIICVCVCVTILFQWNKNEREKALGTTNIIRGWWCGWIKWGVWWVGQIGKHNQAGLVANQHSPFDHVLDLTATAFPIISSPLNPILPWSDQI